jgi:hypothetical protein
MKKAPISQGLQGDYLLGYLDSNQEQKILNIFSEIPVFPWVFNLTVAASQHLFNTYWSDTR